MICLSFQCLQAWPANAKVEAWKMAKAGFRYTGQEEEVTYLSWGQLKLIKELCSKESKMFKCVSPQVTCAWCGCVLGDWQYGDQVLALDTQLYSLSLDIDAFLAYLFFSTIYSMSGGQWWNRISWFSVLILQAIFKSNLHGHVEQQAKTDYFLGTKKLTILSLRPKS